ncbi:hypothetical protein ACHFCA_25820 [Delftia tsuruhatensis]
MLAFRTVTYCTENEETPFVRPGSSGVIVNGLRDLYHWAPSRRSN